MMEEDMGTHDVSVWDGNISPVCEEIMFVKNVGKIYANNVNHADATEYVLGITTTTIIGQNVGDPTNTNSKKRVHNTLIAAQCVVENLLRLVPRTAVYPPCFVGSLVTTEPPPPVG